MWWHGKGPKQLCPNPEALKNCADLIPQNVPVDYFEGDPNKHTQKKKKTSSQPASLPQPNPTQPNPTQPNPTQPNPTQPRRGKTTQTQKQLIETQLRNKQVFSKTAVCQKYYRDLAKLNCVVGYVETNLCLKLLYKMIYKKLSAKPNFPQP